MFPRDVVCVRNVTVDTLHKGDTDDDDDDITLKYEDLEVQRMWKVKSKVIPVKIGATGPISNLFRKYVSNRPKKHEIKELHKTAILGTAHILREMLM